MNRPSYLLVHTLKSLLEEIKKSIISDDDSLVILYSLRTEELWQTLLLMLQQKNWLWLKPWWLHWHPLSLWRSFYDTHILNSTFKVQSTSMQDMMFLLVKPVIKQLPTMFTHCTIAISTSLLNQTIKIMPSWIYHLICFFSSRWKLYFMSRRRLWWWWDCCYSALIFEFKWQWIYNQWWSTRLHFGTCWTLLLFATLLLHQKNFTTSFNGDEVDM